MSRRSVDHVAELVKVLVSRDRRWRVDIRSNGRVEVRELGFLRLKTEEHRLRSKLADLGVDLDQLVED